MSGTTIATNVRNILVPIDFSKYSEAALERAYSLAETFAAPLHLVHVVAEQAEEGTQREAMERLGRSLEPHREMKIDIERVILRGTAHRAIVDYAEQNKIDLIVMGTRGRTGLAHMALGSVAERVLRSTGVPVFVVKPQQADVESELQQSARILHDEFGSILSGQRNMTHAQMKGRLVNVMNVAQVQADQCMHQLESSGVLTWSDRSNGHSQNGIDTEGLWEIDPVAMDSTNNALLPDVPIVTADGQETVALDLIRRALKVRATDIHIDPSYQGNYAIRFRIDGQVEEYCDMDGEVAEHLIQQLKMLGHLDITDPFRPKEGRLRLPETMSDLEVRITTSPVANGEATALRLFSRDNIFFPLENLGFSDVALSAVDEMLRRSEGIILATGPTGSGKTTTVYSMLEFLRKGQRNLVSIEDPVEFAAPFVRQMSVDQRHGITMASGLRTLLRMDPDIIFVGEIRDREAAEIAMRAASSGQHVLSTLHTRDVAATLTALRDLQVDNRSLAGNLNGIINQRLVRRLCGKCMQARPIRDSQRNLFQEFDIQPPATLYEAAGCPQCRGTGYRGRVGVYETVLVDEPIAQAITEGTTENELRQLIRSAGATSISADALQKACNGLTSFHEAKTLRWA